MKSLKRARENCRGVEQAAKKPCVTDAQLKMVHASLGELQSQSSGTVSMPDLHDSAFISLWQVSNSQGQSNDIYHNSSHFTSSTPL
ncbi:hypothetical protein K439DRAFT_1413609 [Ramaria rubella]|nr:hypothetical protein K439DRAFT_1413609 [Ramaria rubella]